MIRNKIIGKKSAILMAALALVSGVASAGRLSHSPINSSHDDNAPFEQVNLSVTNGTNRCVRVFANGQHDLPTNGRTVSVGEVYVGKPYMASIFGKTCGGTAFKNVWLTPDNSKVSANWLVK